MSRPYCLTDPTTPTILIRCLGSNQRCFPVASPFGQKRRANFSSMIATRAAFRRQVELFEEAALNDRDLHRLEVAERRGTQIDLKLLTGRRCPPFNVDRSPADRRGEGQRRDRPSHRHARQGGKRVTDRTEIGEIFVAVAKLPVGRVARRVASRSPLRARSRASCSGAARSSSRAGLRR